MKIFMNSFTFHYILSIDSEEVSSIMPFEPGRSLQVFYDRADFKGIVHEHSLRYLMNSTAFYDYTTQNGDCLEEGFSYNVIHKCNVAHSHYLNFLDIRNNPNVSCCVFYNRTWEDNIMTMEYLCSAKTTLEICVLEARMIQRELGENCINMTQNAKNLTLYEIYEDLKEEDESFKNILKMEPRERGKVQCCSCELGLENIKNGNNYN